jgi:hypothetical protein
MHQLHTERIVTCPLSTKEFIAVVTKEGVSGFIVGAQPIREDLDGYHREHMVKFVPSEAGKETKIVRIGATFMDRDVSSIIEQLDECDIPRIEEPRKPATPVYAQEHKPANNKKPAVAAPIRVQPPNKAATEKRLIQTLMEINS